jgi:hypothetical protein
MELKKRFSRNFQGGVTYALSKTENNSFNFVSGLQVPSQPNLSMGPDDQDRRHRIEGHATMELPFGVQFGTIVDFRTEAPLNVIANGRDLNGDGSTGDWLNESLCVPRTGVVACPGFNYSRNSVRELSTEEANRLRTFLGGAPIANFADNPKYFNVDMTLQKRVRLGGTRSMRFTAEAFNVFNIAQRRYDAANAQILGGTFGVIGAVEGPRAIQFTVQYDF